MKRFRSLVDGRRGAGAVDADGAAEIKVDLSKEQVGKPPTTFEPMVGTWLIAQDGPDKVVMVDGRPWVASKDNPTKLLIESARRLYGTSNEELMDNAKQFAYYPVAILKGVRQLRQRHAHHEVQDGRRRSDRCSGMVFNVKPNGDWLAIRYNDTEHNVGAVGVPQRAPPLGEDGGREGKFMLDRSAWHELKMTVETPTSRPGWTAVSRSNTRSAASRRPGRGGAPPNAELFPANNPVLRPPVSGKVGLWSKTDSTSYFKDFVVSPK